MPTKRYDIFLSYKSEDSDLVERLKNQLVARGARVWLDKDQIRPGDLFPKALADGIENSRSVGLIVTPRSMASGWVENEYYRALALATQGELQLIPLLFEKSALPGFLKDRQYLDFRDESEYERHVDRVIWPGITGKRLHVFVIGGGFRTSAVCAEFERLGHLVRFADYVPVAPSEIYHALEEDARVVAVVDVFEGWPWKPDPIYSPADYVESIFEIRQRTRDTRGDVAFLLHQHPDAFDQAPHSLTDAEVRRLRHYFMIPKRFQENECGFNDAARSEFRREFLEAWMKVNNYLLRSDVQNTREFQRDDA